MVPEKGRTGIVLAPSTRDLTLEFFSRSMNQNMQHLLACCLHVQVSRVMATLDLVSKILPTVEMKIERYYQNWTSVKIQQHFQTRNRESKT